jgi:protein-S-isoprenylcysteine O-methyltransferase Ste14
MSQESGLGQHTSMKRLSLDGISQFHYAWRGWILSSLYLILAWARFHSEFDLAPEWLVLFFIGLIWRLYAGRYIDQHSNGIQMGADNLAIAGPYRLGRHPLYLANIISAISLILFANCLSSWDAGLLALAVILHHVLLAKSEERFLSKALGAPYLDYLKASNSWFGWPSPSTLNKSLNLSRNLALPGTWRRQGGNLGKSILAVLILIVLWGINGYSF